MKIVIYTILGSILAAAITGGAFAQAATPSSPPASAAVPMTAASKQVPTRNAAITAAENAKEPGNQRPEERVIPQIRIPLKSRRNAAAATTPSVPTGNVLGGVDDGAARCMAAGNATDKAACERGLAASAPVKSQR
ncbi:hypothetical protein [Roseateles sp. P5_E7]